MAYPPELPPSTRTDSTVSATNHARDHNIVAAALRSFLEVLGADPAEGYSDLTSRLASLIDDARIAAGAFIEQHVPQEVIDALGADTILREAAIDLVGDAANGLDLVLSDDARLTQVWQSSDFARAWADLDGLVVLGILLNGTVSVPTLDSDTATIRTLNGVTNSEADYAANGDRLKVWTDAGERIFAALRADGALELPLVADLNGTTYSTAPAALNGYLRVWTDSNERIIAGIRLDGRLHIPLLDADEVTVNPGEGGPAEQYAASYDDTPAPMVSGPAVVLVGHSMLAGAASAVTTALAGIAPVTSLSVGGETSRTIAARQGGQPMTFRFVEGTIPAGTINAEVELAYADKVPLLDTDGGWPLLQGASTYLGSVVLEDGTEVAGTFSVGRSPSATQYVHHPDDAYFFRRTNAGQAIAAPRRLPFYHDVGRARRDDILVLWPGRNNVAEPDQVIGDTAAMIQHLRPAVPRFLVLSEHNNANEPVGTTNYNHVIAINNGQRLRYGRRFIDTRAHLIEFGLVEAGLAPTSQDNADKANGIVPTSLRSDATHLNAAGSTIVANLIKRRLLELGWTA